MTQSQPPRSSDEIWRHNLRTVAASLTKAAATAIDVDAADPANRERAMCLLERAEIINRIADSLPADGSLSRFPWRLEPRTDL